IQRFESRILKSNPLRDPYVRDLLIYLPPSYKEGHKTYPVVLCLSGYTGSALSWLNWQAWVPRFDERVDGLIRNGMPEMILVMPDCFTKYGGSQYLDSIAVGRYRSYLIQEIVPFIDKNYRTRPERRFRAVMGKSSGGYGAICIGLEHADIFSAVACHSGDMYFEYCYLPQFPSAHRSLTRSGGLKAVLENFDNIPKHRKQEHGLLEMIAMSACYSPNERTMPHLFDLPFDEETGELRSAVWRQWKEQDPVVMLEPKAEALKKLGLLFLDCGNRDEFSLHLGARIFRKGLLEKGVAHEYEEFEDGHFNIQYRYDISLQKIAKYFTRDS
ncbi:MAG TPA: alpha/beta hydrolase-fold protein, partial [Acidobacteriota bacterium]